MPEIAIRVGAIVRRDAVLALRRPVSLVTRSLGPLTAIAGFYFVARLVDPNHSLAIDGRHAGYFTYVSVNLLFMILLTTALQSFSATVRYDQLIGTLESIFSTATQPGLFVLSCGVWPFVTSALQVILGLGIASSFMGLDLHATNPLALTIFIALSTLTMSAIGIFSAAGVIAFKQVPPSHYLVGGAASLLSGTLFPTHLFPAGLQIVSWCLPLTHALRGIRGAIAGDPLAAAAPDAAWLTIAVVVLLPLSFAVLHYAVERARSEGTLAEY